MNSSNFDKLVKEKLIPIPQKSVVVFENVPFNCVQVNKPPSKYAVKADIFCGFGDMGLPVMSP
jgi:hypothetical protein